MPGSSFSGDQVPAMVNSGERILTMDNQEFMLNASGAGQGNTITVVVMLDSVQIAKSSAAVYGSGQLLIPARGIE